MPTREPGPGHIAACARAGRHWRNRAIAKTAAQYDRRRDLPKILSISPEELADKSAEGRRGLIARLLRLAHNSARAGRTGHWSYDPNRHIAILGALHAERDELTALTREGCNETAPSILARPGVST